MPYTDWRKKYLFDPASKNPHKLSRTKIDLYHQCPRCFYLDQRFGIKRPSGPAFTLNVAVDHLLKLEFDIHRRQQTPHPLMDSYSIDAIPYEHKEIENWRHNFTGIQYLHPEHNLLIFGAIDDVWENKKGELHIVDYKATSKQSAINLDEGWGPVYKRQMEIYQWLFRQNNFKVSNTGYFVYANGRKDRDAFDGKLEFAVEVIPYTGNDEWVNPIIGEIKKCLMFEKVPSPAADCEHCKYVDSAKEYFGSDDQPATTPTSTDVESESRPESVRKEAKKNPSTKDPKSDTLF